MRQVARSATETPGASLFGPARYRIRLGCEVDARWEEWFEGLSLEHAGRGESTLSGVIADQSALHGVLARIRDLGWPLVAVNRVGGPGAEGQGSKACRGKKDEQTRSLEEAAA
jgi:hypothetical protein